MLPHHELVNKEFSQSVITTLLVFKRVSNSPEELIKVIILNYHLLSVSFEGGCFEDCLWCVVVKVRWQLSAGVTTPALGTASRR